MPLAQAIYGGHSQNQNRNYRGNKSKYTDGMNKNILQTKRSLNQPVANSVDQMRMQAFKNNMKEISQNVKRHEESLSILNNIGHKGGSNVHKSPSRPEDQIGNNLELNFQGGIGEAGASNTQQLTGIANNIGISRTRVKGLQNSHSNKRLPTWKAQGQSSLITSEKGISSPTFERGGIADRSLDRVSANAKGNLFSGGGNVLQSRAELLQNEYKKVIENHPGTIIGPGMSKYDDTDFLSRMFTKGPNQEKNENLGLNRQESSEVLHKSQSVKMLGDSTLNTAALAISNAN